jgi:hypothetical protein
MEVPKEAIEEAKAAGTSDDADVEFEAIRSIYAALKSLTPDAQNRVLDYVLKRLGLARSDSLERLAEQRQSGDEVIIDRERQHEPSHEPIKVDERVDDGDDLEGVSQIAKKWMKRNGLSSEQLSRLFSLGVDEIDLVAEGVPGRSMKEKQRAVVLLQGLAGLLSAGAARVTDQKLREACGHYDAYDQKNYATNMRDFGAEVTGTKESGYTLTTRGLAAAAGLVKEMTRAAD